MGVKLFLASVVAALALAGNARAEPLTLEPPEFIRTSTVTQKTEPKPNLEELVHTAGGNLHARFELPDQMKFIYFGDTRFSLGQFVYKTASQSALYGTVDLRSESQKLLSSIADSSVSINNMPFSTFRREAETQLPAIAADARTILSSFWDDVRAALHSREVEVNLTFASFFRELLPEYTTDGVVTPDEMILIEKAVQHRLEEYYHQQLTPQERKDINNAVQKFSNSFNERASKYSFVRNAQFLAGAQDPLSLITTGSINARKLYEMITGLAPLYSLTLGENSFRIESNLHSRLLARGEHFQTYQFPDYTFRQGFLSLSTGVVEAHLQIDGEVHGGRPIRDFFGKQYKDDFAVLEFLLGYQPVFVDGTISGEFRGAGNFENRYVQGYEAATQHQRMTLGLGFVQGYVYRVQAQGDASFHAESNSNTSEMTGSFSGNLRWYEEQGLLNQIYFSLLHNDRLFWSSTYLQLTMENVHSIERIWAANFNAQANFNGSLGYSYSYGQLIDQAIKFRADLSLATQLGLHLHPADPFLFLRGDKFGTGITITTPHFLVQTETEWGYSVSGNALFPFPWWGNEGKIPLDIAHNSNMATRQQVDSPFPATQAMLLEERQNIYSALNGAFLEVSGRLQDTTPQEVPFLMRTGIVAARDDEFYLRLGYCGDWTSRASGVYTEAGNKVFELQAQYLSEEISSRNSAATTISQGGKIYFGKYALTVSGTLYTPAIGKSMINKSEEGDIIYNIIFEGPIDSLPMTFDQIELTLWKLSKIKF